MATQTITASVNADGIANWHSADTLVINNGATVTVDTDQPKFWATVTINDGTLLINNQSDTAIRFLMGRASGVSTPTITLSSGLAKFETRGKLIQVGIGDGSPSQSFTIPYTDHVPCMWVEKTPGSDDYEQWVNLSQIVGPAAVPNRYGGLTGMGQGRRGHGFEQSTGARSGEIIYLATLGTTNGSRTITTTSTSGLISGAVITAVAGIPAATVIEQVIDSTTFTTNLAATVTGTTSGTMYPHAASQWGNVVTFGDGKNGAVIPSGCKVKIANILITTAVSTNLVAYSYSCLGVFVGAGGAIEVGNTMFSMMSGEFPSMQKLRLTNVGVSYPLNISRCYDLVIDGLALTAPPFIYRYSGNGLLLSSPGELWAYHLISYFAGSLSNIVARQYGCYIGANTFLGGVLSLRYAENIDVSDVLISSIGAHRGAPGLSLEYVSNSRFNRIDVYSPCAIALSMSNGNIIDGVTMGLSPVHEHAGSYLSHNMRVVIKCLPSGEPFQEDTDYFIKLVTNSHLMSNCRVSDQVESPEQSFKVYNSKGYNDFTGPGFWTTETTVEFHWNNRPPTHNAPAYRIYRSTDPLVPIRDATTQIFTTNTATTSSYSHSIVGDALGSVYYYVIRKYTSATEFFDTPPMYGKKQVSMSFTNLLLQSETPSASSWSKSGVTATANVTQAHVRHEGSTYNICDSILSTYANGTLSQGIATAIGTTYRFIFVVAYLGKFIANAAPVETADIKVKLGTTEQTFTVGRSPTRLEVTFTATATTTSAVVTIPVSGELFNWVGSGVQSTGINASWSETLTATQNTKQLISALFLNAPWVEGESHFNGVKIATNTSIFAAFPEVHIGTAPGFTPTADTLVCARISASYENIYLAGSSSNVIRNFVQSGSGADAYRSNIHCSIGSCDNLFEGVVYNTDAYIGAGNNSGNGLAYIISGSNNNKFKDISISNLPFDVQYGNLIRQSTDASGTVFENVNSGFKVATLAAISSGCIFKGIGQGAYLTASANTVLDLSAAIPLVSAMSVLTNVYDTHFSECYITETKGYLRLHFSASTKTVPPYTLSGVPTFSNTGRLYFYADGDGITYTWPHKIYGVSGFDADRVKLYTVDLGNSNINPEGLLVEMMVDTGSGWTRWYNTYEDLSTLSVSATDGFYLKIRITARNFVKFTSGTGLVQVGEVVRAGTGGGTATVEEVYGTSIGTLVLSNVQGAWSAGTIVRNSDSTLRGTIALTNGSAIGPQRTSYINTLLLHTDIDTSVKYPSDAITLSLVGVVAGSDVVVRLAGTESVLANYEDTSGGTVPYTYYTAGSAVDIDIYKPGYIPLTTIRNYTLTDQSSSIPVVQAQDPSYLD